MEKTFKDAICAGNKTEYDSYIDASYKYINHAEII